MSSLRRMFRYESRKRDLQEEIQAHLQMDTADRIAQGESPGEARAAALRELGNVPLIEDVTRESWGWLGLEHLGQDLGYALRQVRRSPGFAAVVIGTLGLGVGAATALFSVVDHAILRPVAYRDPGGLMQVLKSSQFMPAGTEPEWTDIEQWSRQSRSFLSMAYWIRMGGRGDFLVREPASVEISGTRVSANLFETLGVAPEIGRSFAPSGAGGGSNTGAALISDALWRKALGADRGIVGSAIRIDDRSYTVIGVMPPGFAFPANVRDLPQVWIPIDPAADEAAAQRDGQHAAYFVLARLRPGVTPAGAGAEMNLIAGRVAAQSTAPGAGRDGAGALVTPYAGTLVPADVRRALVALLGASLALWLTAVVNATNLLLARATSRQREIAIRGALGASRGRVLQQMLVEGLLLSGAASLLGLGLSIVSVRLLARPLEAHLPLGAPPLVPDGWMLLSLLGMTMLTAALATLWPAWMIVRAPIEPALRQGGLQAGTARSQHRLRGVLVSIEIAMSFTLLVSCGLLLRTIYALGQVRLGFRVDHVLVARLDIPRYRFAGRDVMTTLYKPLLERVEQLPGVEAAGMMNEAPLSRGYRVQLGLINSGRMISAALGVMTPGVQRVFAMHMLAGRFFDAGDTPDSDAKVVVNRAFARAFAPERHDPASVIGMTMWQLRKDRPLHIVGVLDDERSMSITEPSTPQAEVCVCQMAPDVDLYKIASSATELAVRTGRPASEIVPELRALLRQAAPELEQADITTMDRVVEDSYGSQRLAARLLEGFGGAALLLSIAGLYGLLAYVVARRTQELGVRIALGAPRGSLLRLVMRQAATMLLLGVAAGAVLAWLCSRFVRGFLYGVDAHDGWTLAAAALLLCACGLSAAYLPARRAARVDPIVALRAE